MIIRRGTTPTLEIALDADLTGWDVYVTISQGSKRITKNDPQIAATQTGCKVTCAFTQAETLSLRRGAACVQVRAIAEDDAVATEIVEIEIGDVLLNGEIPREV